LAADGFSAIFVASRMLCCRPRIGSSFYRSENLAYL